jgi:hypothetical protein
MTKSNLCQARRFSDGCAHDHGGEQVRIYLVDAEGSVVGCGHCQLCLNDAISKLERSAVKNSSAADDAVRQAVSQQEWRAQAAALQATGQPYVAGIRNKATPTLRSLLAR